MTHDGLSLSCSRAPSVHDLPDEEARPTIHDARQVDLEDILQSKDKNMVEQITVEEFHVRLRAQSVNGRRHCALVCPVCQTVQSIASLILAGASEDRAENMVGFSCEGRLTGAGEWPRPKDKSVKAAKRRTVRGCNWTLGGLFTIHALEVLTEDGQAHPRFVIATSEQAQELEADLASRMAQVA